MTGQAAAQAPGDLMRAEIAEQPERWLGLLAAGRDELEAAAALMRAVDPQLVVFAARGSSDHAAMYGQYLVHNLLGVPAMLATPSTVSAFGTQLRYPRSVMLAVSQSGASPDLLDTVRAAKRDEVPVVAFTNNADSPLAGLADVHVDVRAGAELSVAATKTYTAEILAMNLVLSLAAGQTWESLEHAVTLVSQAASRTIHAMRRDLGALARSLGDPDRLLVVGRGYSMSSAKEGALKLMETNALAASGWSAADAIHGPLGQVVEGSVAIVLTSSEGGRQSVQTFAAAAADLGARVIEIRPARTVRDLGASGDHIGIDVGTLDAVFVPLVEVLPLQQLALELAVRRDRNPDAPAGLKKVTLTR